MKIVLDTSIFVDYLRSKKGLYPLLIGLGKSKSTTLYTPSIVIVELWAGESMVDSEIVKVTKRLIAPTKTIGLSRQLAERAGELLRENFVRDSEDSVIAATTLYLEAQLATNNVKHFEKVKGLGFFMIRNLWP